MARPVSLSHTGLKSQIFLTPLSFSTLVRGDPLQIYKKSFTVPETKVFQAADSEDLAILACTIFD